MIRVKVPAAFMEKVTIRRYAAGTYVDGTWQEGAQADISLLASVQPLTAGDYRRLPEGNSGLMGYKLFTNATLVMGVEGSTRADHLLYDGKLFKLVSLEDWKKNGYTSASFTEAK